MTELDIAPVTVPAAPPRLIDRPMPTLFTTRLRAPANLNTRARIAVVAGVGLIACGAAYLHMVANALAGSRTAYLVVVPLLLALIATGYRSAPRGVNDSEADWIIATLFAVVGLTGIYLLSQRTPTLAGLWQLPLFGAVLVCACSIAVLFSVRHVAMMWALWLFALCALTPWPYLVAVAALGGSDTAAALVAAGLGTVAVFLGGRPALVRHRLIATAACLTLASAVSLAAGRLGMVTAIVIAAGFVPTVAVAVLARIDGSLGRNPTTEGTRRPTSLPSLIVLILAAVLVAVFSPHRAGPVPVTTAAANWDSRIALGAPTSFPFITRFLGSGATLVRYPVPSVAGLPDVAVDVMTTPNLAAIADLADTVWYPSSRPIDYRKADPARDLPLGASIIHSDADSTTDTAGRDWYAITWVWQVGAVYQRISVVVSQTVGDSAPPPAPQPPTLFDTGLRPALWLARQQPDAHSPVDELVVERAVRVIGMITAAGALGPTQDRDGVSYRD